MMPFIPWGATSGGGQQPYQFRPETYGAAGNGVVCADVSTNATTTITSPTVAAKAVAGQTIMINGANGATAGPLITTIQTVTGTGAVLASAAAATASGCATVFGNDDTSSINQAISAASTYAQANDYFAEVLFSAKVYMLAAAPTQTTSPAVQNAQIPIPYPNVNGQTRKLCLSLKGAGNAGQLQYWESVSPNLQGTCLVSTQTAPSTASPTFGQQSVIGGPSGTAGLTGSFANTKLSIDGITVWTPVLTNMYAYDFAYLSGVEWGGFSHQGFAPANNASAAAAAHPYLADLPSTMVAQLEATIGVGCRFPLVGNNDDVCGQSFASEGILIGVIAADHFASTRLATLYVDVGMRIDLVNGISGNAHGVSVGNWSIESYNGGLTCNGGGAGMCPVSIFMDTETIGGAANPVYDVSDNGNLFGVIHIGDANGRTSRQVVTLNGPKNLKIINDMVGPGHMAAPPAVPASGSAAAVQYRDATVSVHTGAAVTVSIISVDGTATGQTMAASSSLTVRVPSGKTIALTYAGGTPTWDWWLD